MQEQAAERLLERTVIHRLPAQRQFDAPDVLLALADDPERKGPKLALVPVLQADCRFRREQIVLVPNPRLGPQPLTIRLKNAVRTVFAGVAEIVLVEDARQIQIAAGVMDEEFPSILQPNPGPVGGVRTLATYRRLTESAPAAGQVKARQVELRGIDIRRLVCRHRSARRRTISLHDADQLLRRKLGKVDPDVIDSSLPIRPAHDQRRLAEPERKRRRSLPDAFAVKIGPHLATDPIRHGQMVPAAESNAAGRIYSISLPVYP